MNEKLRLSHRNRAKDVLDAHSNYKYKQMTNMELLIQMAAVHEAGMIVEEIVGELEEELGYPDGQSEELDEFRNLNDACKDDDTILVREALRRMGGPDGK